MKKETVLKRVAGLDKYALGHALKSHFDEEDGYLIHRVIDERKPLATSFVNVTPEKVTNYIIKKLSQDTYVEGIYNWVNDYTKADTLKIAFNFKNAIGKGFFKAAWHNWEEGSAPCHQLTVVLRRTDDEAQGFVVASVYPTVNQTDMDMIAARHEDYMANKMAQ